MVVGTRPTSAPLHRRYKLDGLVGALQREPLPHLEDPACEGEPPEMFFPVSMQPSLAVDNAKAICSRCPVETMLTCRDYALRNPQLSGVWGGLTDPERRFWRRNRRR